MMTLLRAIITKNVTRETFTEYSYVIAVCYLYCNIWILIRGERTITRANANLFLIRSLENKKFEKLRAKQNHDIAFSIYIILIFSISARALAYLSAASCRFFV